MTTEADPKTILVRDRDTGQPKSISTDVFPDWMKPPVWCADGRAFWPYSGMVKSREIKAYLDERLKKGPPITRALVIKLALYVETYAKHIVMGIWLLNPDPAYGAGMEAILEKLTTLRQKARTGDDVAAMVDLCMEAGIDPL